MSTDVENLRRIRGGWQEKIGKCFTFTIIMFDAQVVGTSATRTKILGRLPRRIVTSPLPGVNDLGYLEKQS